MRQVIKLIGGASQRIRLLEVQNQDLEKDLLSFLRSQDIPVASSCSGEGKCKKCLFNKSELACMAIVKDYVGKEIVIDYL